MVITGIAPVNGSRSCHIRKILSVIAPVAMQIDPAGYRNCRANFLQQITPPKRRQLLAAGNAFTANIVCGGAIISSLTAPNR